MRNLIFKFGLLGLVYLGGCNAVIAQLGIGTNLPQARLHVYGGTLLSQTPKLDPQNSPFYDPANFDDDSVRHAFIWMPEKSAFRVMGGSIYGNALDPAAVGKFSFASGFDVFATGLSASARGLRTSASGFASFACGRGTLAGENFSFGQGLFTSANGPSCVAIGTNLSNNYLTGAFVLGHTDFSFQSASNNQVRMLFTGGYRFYTNSLLITGALLPAGANAWSVVSDVRKKEKFAEVNGREFLRKIAEMPLSSWNYKGQDIKTFRHYGPMAQDFYKSFGKDRYGLIGTDTTISHSDLDGVTLIAIKALIEETDELQKLNDDLEHQLVSLRKRLSQREYSRPRREISLAKKSK
ncbi:tail fiber domain-containing protein [Dyadobacter jiangsuensis]